MVRRLTLVFTEEENLQLFAEELAKGQDALWIDKLTRASINQTVAAAQYERNPVVIVNFSNNYDMYSNENLFLSELLNKIENVVIVIVSPLFRTFELTDVENSLDLRYVFATHYNEDETLQLYYDNATKKYLIDENGNHTMNKRAYQVTM